MAYGKLVALYVWGEPQRIYGSRPSFHQTCEPHLLRSHRSLLHLHAHSTFVVRVVPTSHILYSHTVFISRLSNSGGHRHSRAVLRLELLIVECPPAVTPGMTCIHGYTDCCRVITFAKVIYILSSYFFLISFVLAPHHLVCPLLLPQL